MVKNKKYENFVFISRFTGKCAKIDFCSSSLWTCLHHNGQNKNTDFFMIDFSLIVSL